MGEVSDINITGLEKGKIAANLGDAHEHIVAGILIRLGFDVGIVDVHGTPFDLMIMGFDRPNGKTIVLRAQVKTATRAISFIGGCRGGIDRNYKSGVKTYKYDENHSDLILGIDKETLDIYVIPTRFILKWGSSKSIRKLQSLKNNWEILLNWNDGFLSSVETGLASAV